MKGSTHLDVKLAGKSLKVACLESSRTKNIQALLLGSACLIDCRKKVHFLFSTGTSS